MVPPYWGVPGDGVGVVVGATVGDGAVVVVGVPVVVGVVGVVGVMVGWVVSEGEEQAANIITIVISMATVIAKPLFNIFPPSLIPD